MSNTMEDTKNWEHSSEVQDFINTDTPTIEEYATAYHYRDVHGFNISFDKVKSYSLKKLFPSKNQLLFNKIRHDVKINLDNTIRDLSLNDDTFENLHNSKIFEFDCTVNLESILETINENLKRYNILNDIENHKEFYMAMTESELACLGW